MVKVFKPTQPFSEKQLTKISKPDFFAGLINYGKRIMKSASTDNATATVYTIPAGKSFFMISAQATFLNISGTNNQVGQLYLDDNTEGVFLAVRLMTSAAESQNISFPVPIKIDAGSIYLSSTAVNFFGRAAIIGYEVDTANLPLFVA